MKNSKRLCLVLILVVVSMLLFTILNACTSAVEFKVDFIVDGEVYHTINTAGKTKITMPDNPTKDGYKFDGWYWDENEWQKPVTGNSLLETPLTADMKVYAKFSEIKENDEIALPDESVELGDLDLIGKDFTKEETTLKLSVSNETTEFDFANKIKVKDTSKWGIYLEISCINKVNSKIIPLNIGDNTVYILVADKNEEVKLYTAIIHRNRVLTVTFYHNDRPYNVTTKQIEEGLEYGELPELTRDGYSFDGWYYGETKIDATTKLQASTNHAINAKWTGNTYKVSFSSDIEGLNKEPINVVYGSAYGELPQINIDGYTLKWKINNQYIYNTSIVSVLGDHVLESELVPNTYYVTFNSNGGSRVYSKTVTYDSTYGTLSTPSKTGYIFDGWYLNETLITESSKVEILKDATLNAKWRGDTYTISFTNNKGDAPVSQNVVYGSSYDLPALNDITGYTFAGWTYNGTLLNTDKWNIANNCTLTAKWEPKVYTVTINPNGGSVASLTKQVKYGEKYTLPVATNSDKPFMGWIYNNVLITNENGASISTWTFTEDIEVTTLWEIEISTAEDLQLLKTYPKGNFILTNNIDITLQQWEPIRKFEGIINGNNHIINGLTISQLNDDGFYAFIAEAEECVIKNLIFTNVYINIPAINKDSCIATVVGCAIDCSLDHIIASGEIVVANHNSSYDSYAAGIIGINGSTKNVLTNITNNVNIAGKTYAAGVIAVSINENSEFNLSKIVNNGNVSGKISGGIIAFSQMDNLTECINLGAITGISDAGGILGNVRAAKVQQCANKGNITLTNENATYQNGSGGIIGSYVSVYGSSTSIKDCYNQGTITGSGSAGGIVGAWYNNGVISDIEIYTSYNTGNVTGKSYAGGIAGNCIGGVCNCANYGEITSDSICEEITYILIANNTIIENCYTSSTALKTREFYKEQLFFSEDVWILVTDEYPVLKCEVTLLVS